ncbi:doublecortin domain-containing protein 2-like, partial [Babylonia areolata]|uniref:doublecortin domain-containing protein 2-like n=1 Tax=Babylonia areolata TaxID=304850 RepID=UPI003FD4FC4F
MEKPIEPNYMRGSIRARYNVFCVNGDYHQPGKKVILNTRHFKDLSHYLDHLTDTLQPPFGAVRKVHTPFHGRRVRSLEDFQTDELYVVAGRERFKQFRYEEIPQKRKHHRVSYDLPPGSKKRYQVSGRHRKVNVQGMIIRCWRNGRTNQGAKPVNIRPVRDDSLEKVMRLVSDTLRERLETLYTHPDGVEVTSMEQIASHGMYVAAKNRSESFQSLTYTELAPANISNYVHHSPSPERRHGSLPQLRSNKTSSQSSPEHSVSSNNGSENSYTQRYRRERAKREEDGVFHARPVKHKRSSEKVRQTDYDQDNRGVFKAKSQNQATLGARQVDESRQTKTDVPVDQRQAEEVKEDVKGKDKKDKKGKKPEEEDDDDDGGELSSPRRPDQQRTYRSNARRPDSPGNEQARREAERKAQEKRAAEDRERAEKARKEQEAMRRKKEDKDKKKNGKKAEEQKEAQKRRQQEVEEERRKEEERNAAEERRRREEEEEEEKRKKAAGASSPKHRADKGNRTPSPQRRGESPYRSGTELVREEDGRNNRHNDNDNWDDRTPTPGKETSRGGRGGDSRASQNRHDGRRRREEEEEQ